MAKKVGVMDFANVCRNALNEYGLFAHETIDDLVPEAADIAVKMIRHNSKKRTGAYAKDWAKKRIKAWGYGSTYCVYNRKHYRVAHLLERSHEVRNQYGTFGDTAGDGVIAEAEEYSTAWLINMISAKLEGNSK